MFKKFILFFLFTTALQYVSAQQSTVKRAQSNYEEAQQYVRQSIFDEAIKYLDLAVKADPKFEGAYVQLADIYKRLKTYDKAKINYKLAISSSLTFNARAHFFLGECEILTGDYANAKQHFTLFVQKYDGEEKEFVLKAKKYIADCDFAQVAIKNPVVYTPINLGFYINSENRDYFPALTADLQTIIFSRVIKGNEDFYTSNKVNGAWEKALPLSDAINTANYNEGAQSISPDGKYLFFTACNRPDGLGRCDIYITKKEGSNWGKPANLGPTVNGAEWESQPSISPDGNTLYFVSNRPGGFGGYDIWKTTLNDDYAWGQPVNLGPEINTPFDETTPFIHADNKTLYFSSDGWPGFGDKDIFYSKLQSDEKFTKPINLGYPINTFNEETGLFVTADGKKGIFSSNLGGGFGDVDIYEFDLPAISKPFPVTYVKGVIKDKDSNETLEASVLVYDLINNQAVYNDYTSAENGSFLAVMPINHQYSFNAQADGYLFYSAHYELNNTNTTKPFEIEILLEKIKVGSEVVLNNIFFETNKFELLPTSKVELEVLTELLNSNPNVSIEIQGHTDNVGDIKMNQKLSENRAKAVYDFLLQNKISAKRLTFKGYGESKPKTENATAEGRKQNRRTEFVITKI